MVNPWDFVYAEGLNPPKSPFIVKSNRDEMIRVACSRLGVGYEGRKERDRGKREKSRTKRETEK